LFFQRSPSPKLEFCKAKSRLDGHNLMLHDDWLDIPCIVILRHFCSKPRMVSDIKYPKECSYNYISMLILRGYHNRRWKLKLSLKSSCFRTQARPWETLNCVSSWRSGFPSNTNLCILISRFIQWDLKYLW
jgi:hypothetical protein